MKNIPNLIPKKAIIAGSWTNELIYKGKDDIHNAKIQEHKSIPNLWLLAILIHLISYYNKTRFMEVVCIPNYI